MEVRTPSYATRYSSAPKNIRLVTWCLRFVDKCRKKNRESGKLSQQEIWNAEKRVLRLIQNEAFNSDDGWKKKCTVKVKTGEDGLIVVETKLINREDKQYFRLPILLPHSHPFVTQIIREEHMQNGHAGIQYLMSQLREKYWILQSRKSIRKVVTSCVRCRRHALKKQDVESAPLPSRRVQDATVLQITGVDLAGPLVLKCGEKVWIVLFTCAVFRAVHLELVTACSTEEFILALSRFVSRRGRPTTIYSDNGTNFVGADNLFKKLNWEKIESTAMVKKIQWIFNPPSGLWWGGFWERLIRSVKDLLKRMLGKSRLNKEQLITCLCEVEGIINARPLTYVREDADDLIPLTPAMFIQSQRESNFPEMRTLDEEDLRSKYREMQTLRRELQQRFRKEYLGLLVQKQREKSHYRFQQGEVVLIGSDNRKRLEWPMGRIVELIAGTDGVCRVAKVKTTSGVLTRPLQRLFPLEISSEANLPDVPATIQKIAKSNMPDQTNNQSIATLPVVQTRSGRMVQRPIRFRDQ